MGKSAVFQYVHIGGGAKGVPVGGSIRNGRAVIRIRGAGNPRPYELRSGLLSANGSMDIIPVAGGLKSLVDYAIFDETTKKLPVVAIAVGHESTGYNHTGCLVESLELSMTREEAVRASIAWQGVDFEEDAGGVAPGVPAGDVIMFDQVTIGGITAKVQMARLSIANSLKIDVALGSYKPAELEGTGQEITLSLETLAHEALLLGGAAPTVQDITLTCTGGVVIVCKNATPNEQEMPIEEDGTIIHTNNFDVKYITTAAG